MGLVAKKECRKLVDELGLSDWEKRKWGYSCRISSRRTVDSR